MKNHNSKLLVAEAVLEFQLKFSYSNLTDEEHTVFKSSCIAVCAMNQRYSDVCKKAQITINVGL